MVSRLKFSVLWLGTVLLIWAAVGISWYRRSYIPSNSELLQGGGAVPILLILAYVLLRRVLNSMFNPAIEPVHEELQQEAATPALAKGRQMQLLVLGGCIKVPVGGAQELIQACAEGVRPELDGQLRDRDDIPVVAARVAELDDIDLQEWWSGLNLEAGFAQGSAWVTQLPAARARELRLLAQVLADSAAALERNMLSAVEQLLLAAGTSSSADVSETPLPLVHVRLELQQGWTQNNLNELLTWSGLWLAQAAPVLKFEVQLSSPQQADMPENSQARYLWPDILLDAKDAALMPDCAERVLPEDVWLLASAHSEISQTEVDRLDFSGRLYGPSSRDGRIVGEGAAALVLLRMEPNAKSAVWGAGLQFPAVASATVLPATASTGKLASPAIAAMLENCGVPATNVGLVATDADHRSASAMAAASLLAQQFPALSLEKNCTMMGVPCGNTARVSALANWIVAAEFVALEQRAALALTLTSEPWHAALLIPRAWDAALAAAEPQVKTC